MKTPDLFPSRSISPILRRMDVQGEAGPGDRWVGLGIALGIAILAGCDPSGGQAPPARAPAAAGTPSLLLITVDTLRADHLGAYGYAAARTPVIDALARDGVLFETVRAHHPNTAPSHATILTGVYPSRHGLWKNGVALPDAATTLADELAASGYRTAAFVSGYTLTDHLTRFGERFDHYDDHFAVPSRRDRLWQWASEHRLRRIARWVGLRPPAVVLERPAAATTDAALAWLHEHGSAGPFFLWVHYFDVHGPYDPPPPFDRAAGGLDLPRNWYAASIEQRERVVASERDQAGMVALYDGEIAYVDQQLGRLLGGLPAPDRTLVALTADHGESFGAHEHYFDHDVLFEDVLRVPLVLRMHGVLPRGLRVEQSVRHVDLAPTLRELLGESESRTGDGRSLIPLIAGARDALPATPSFAAQYRAPTSGLPTRYALQKGRFKFLLEAPWWADTTRMAGTGALYDTVDDPGEENDLLAEQPEKWRELRAELEAWEGYRPTMKPADALDDATRSRLEALGYMQ